MATLNKYSQRITQDPSQPASQADALWHRFDQRRSQKPQVGIVSTGYEGNTATCTSTT